LALNTNTEPYPSAIDSCINSRAVRKIEQETLRRYIADEPGIDAMVHWRAI
jgi:hypothetical protein